jgi:hypothetical protein
LEEIMGFYMKEDDIYISSLIDLFNLRFAPVPFSTELKRESLYGGIEEMAALQKEFEIFRKGVPFSDSAALLGLGGLYSARAKNRWFTLLGNLPDKGDQKIADALAANFRKRPPLPCYMCAHFFEGPKSDKNRVIINEGAPLFYLEQTYLIISLPMAPRQLGAARKKRKK